jgi:two-component system sensor histidine kinase/response regulator
MSTETWRVLLVDDDEVDRMAVRRALAAAEVSVVLDEIDRASEVFTRLSPPGDAYDCLMIDCYLPGTSGVEVIRELRARGVTTPILAVTGQDDSAIEEALLAAGASDYLPKQDWRPDRLARRLRYAIRVGRTEASYAAALALAKRAVQDRDDLLSIVTHDLRSPLNAIRIASDELADPELDPEERKVMVGAVQRSLRRADRLIEDLLDVSRIEAGRITLTRTRIGARELLEQAVNDHALQSREAGLELRLAVDANAGLVFADRERVLQVLGNLIANALRYARDSGTLILAVEDHGEFASFSVTDRGPGIPAEQLPYVFNRFFQARHHRRAGAGLGLAIAKGIIEAHGGTISALSTVGSGTRFTFSLPRQQRLT